MVTAKLTEEDLVKIKDSIKKGVSTKVLAQKYGVDRSTIQKRAKDVLSIKKIPLETRNKVIKAIKKGYTKAEAAQMYELNIGTAYNLTRGIAEVITPRGEPYHSQERHTASE